METGVKQAQEIMGTDDLQGFQSRADSIRNRFAHKADGMLRRANTEGVPIAPSSKVDNAMKLGDLMVDGSSQWSHVEKALHQKAEVEAAQQKDFLEKAEQLQAEREKVKAEAAEAAKTVVVEPKLRSVEMIHLEAQISKQTIVMNDNIAKSNVAGETCNLDCEQTFADPDGLMELQTDFNKILDRYQKALEPAGKAVQTIIASWTSFMLDEAQEGNAVNQKWTSLASEAKDLNTKDVAVIRLKRAVTEMQKFKSDLDKAVKARDKAKTEANANSNKVGVLGVTIDSKLGTFLIDTFEAFKEPQQFKDNNQVGCKWSIKADLIQAASPTAVSIPSDRAKKACEKNVQWITTVNRSTGRRTS